MCHIRILMLHNQLPQLLFHETQFFVFLRIKQFLQGNKLFSLTVHLGIQLYRCKTHLKTTATTTEK